MAQKSPTELTALFEHIAGSEALRRPYEEAEARKAAAEERTGFIFSRKKAITAEKRQKKEQKEEAERHMRLQAELVRAVAPCRAVLCSCSWTPGSRPCSSSRWFTACVPRGHSPALSIHVA